MLLIILVTKSIKIQISQFAKSTKIKVSKIIKLQLKKTWGCHGDGSPGSNGLNKKPLLNLLSRLV